jgi:hypothetical protein
MRNVGEVLQKYQDDDPGKGMAVTEPLAMMARTYALVSIAESLAILATKGET